MSLKHLGKELRAVACAAALGALTVAITHAATPESSDVIAESSRARITLADYEAEITKLPPELRGEFAASELRLKQYLDNMYMSRVLAADARAAGLDKDPAIMREIAGQVEKVLAKARVDRIDAAAAAEFDKSLDKYVARARELYAVNRASYSTPEQVRAAHILVAVKDGDRGAALRRADELRTKAQGGADFSALAREFSDDPTAARNGGELGFFDAKAMDPAFAAAAFAMTRKGEISAPVLTKFGYHIILLEDRRPAGVRTFEEVKPELLADQKSKAIGEAKAAETRRIFSDPTLKVNAELIERLNTDSAIRSDSSGILAPAKKP
jgi:peptidyl-prolyl cis-trans isomerase C